MGITLAGIGFGGLSMASLAGFLISRFGWRMAFISLGSLVLFVVATVVLGVVRSRPSDRGLVPDGEPFNCYPAARFWGDRQGRQVMIRLLACALFLFAAWQSQASPPQAASPQPAESAEAREAPSPQPALTLDERNQELLRMHNGIWSLMGLSPNARDELNSLVVSINTNVHENKDRYPEEFAKARMVKRSETPLAHDEYVASHKRRFELLGISMPTQEELFGALEFVWKALHDPAVPEEQREAAIAIREMMKSMGGPPPCCDDNIFIRAGMGG